MTGSAKEILREKLAFLLREAAISSDPEAKFSISKRIEEIRRHLGEHETAESGSALGDLDEPLKGLEDLYRRREELILQGMDTTEVNEEIVALRRNLREGGRLRVGDHLCDGRFRLAEEIGRGGFGSVWKAFDRKQGLLVAVKVLHGQYAEDRTRRERFFRGARQMARLRHQGIVSVVEERLEDEGFLFFVMEYVGGGDLRQEVLTGARTLEERLRIVLEAGEALAFAHSHGVLHRDVKPGNILLDEAGHAKITDFDLVRAADTTGGTRTGMMGTVVYAAPELMARAQEVGIPADVYGLGMTATFVAYGRELPLEVLRDAQGFLAHLEVPLPVKAALSRAVAWEAEDRHRSMIEFCRELAAGVELVASEAFELTSELELGGSTLEQASFLKLIPWGRELFRRLGEDGAQVSRLLTTSPGRWLLQVRMPNKLRDLYGTASEVLLLAVSGEIRGEDLEEARDELQRREYDLDLDLLIVVDGHPGLKDRLDRIYRLWGQWVPWGPVDGVFPPLAAQFRPHLSPYDLFEVEDPVRGRQVIGRNDLVADISKRLQRGQALGIFGLRKVGKTTLCRAVTDKLDPISRSLLLARKADRLAFSEVAMPVVWIDARDVFPRTLDALTEKLARELEDRLVLENVEIPRATRDHPLANLSRLLAAASQDGRWPVCIVFDEYDLLFETEDGDPAIQEIDQLFRMFRAHAQSTHRLALVAIGRDSEYFDRPEMNGRPNPMLNWFVPRWLGPMEPRDADELLKRLGRRVGLDVGEETARLARHWTGGHPLLHRQLGSALLELAREKSRQQEHVPTDPFCADAIDLFLDRDAVLTTCRDVYFLLAKRYPEAFVQLRELSHASPKRLGVMVEAVGGWHHPAVRTLRKFGLLLGTAADPVIPELLLWYSRFFALDTDRVAV